MKKKRYEKPEIEAEEIEEKDVITTSVGIETGEWDGTGDTIDFGGF